MGTGGHGWFISEALEVAHDVGVLSVDHVLVSERGARRRAADSCHERLEAGPARTRRASPREADRNPLMSAWEVAGTHTRARKLLRRIG